MEKPDPKEVAKMLRKPEGEFGIKVALRMNESNRNIIQWAIEKLSIQNNDRVLEIGFGNGSHIPKILSKASMIKYTGLDISETMVNIVEKEYAKEIELGQLTLHLGSSSEMPFSHNTFDKIFTVNTIYFWEDPIEHLKQIYNVLKPGGLFCLAFKSKSFMQNLPFVQHGFIHYDQSDAMELLKAVGFKIENLDYRKEAPLDVNGIGVTPDAILISASK